MSKRARCLWIVDPSVATAEHQGVSEILAAWRGESRVFQPCLTPGDGPGPGTGYDTDGIVVMGSSASVHDGHAWLASLAQWLGPVIEGQIERPVLGICFGHQLVAHLAGGLVDHVRLDRSKLKGIEISHLVAGRLLRRDRDARVVVSHGEEVKEVPAGYRVTAHRPGVPIDGLEHAVRPIFAYQFHPEAREEFASRSGIDPRAIDGRVREDGRLILQAFLDLLPGASVD